MDTPSYVPYVPEVLTTCETYPTLHVMKTSEMPLPVV